MLKNWSNTALVAYSSLQKIVKSLDNCFLSRVNSGFQGLHLRNGVTNEKLIGEIIEINDEKRKIINLHFIVTSALKQLSAGEQQIIEQRVFLKRTFKDISEDTGIPMRTLFRRFDTAQTRFALVLERMGYGESWLEKEYSKDKYVSAVYRRVMEEKYFVAKSC